MKQHFVLLTCALGLMACEKDTPPAPLSDYDPSAATEALKDAASFPVGAAVNYNNFLANPPYSNLVKRDFNSITLENEMKNASIVKGGGTFDFSRADAMVDAAGNLQIFGHTLVWHTQQAASYYKSAAGITSSPAASQEEIAAKLDAELRRTIGTIAGHYKGKVKAWDVINELFADNGAIRNNSNTSTSGSDVLVWSHYLGKNLGAKAFQYAAEADPSAKLFLNDYGLESNPAKLDSLIAFVNELKATSVKIDGIGTQMHISLNTPRAGIESMFKKLAATGLLVRVSELDIRVNPGSATGFVFTPAISESQAEMYHFVVKSYIDHVPSSQRHGITVWGVMDASSWRYQNGNDFPLLYDNQFNKKPAYAGFLKALN